MKRTSVVGLVIAGNVVPAFVLWMMIFKPF